MPTIRITDKTMSAIRSRAIFGIRESHPRQPDGTWLVDVDHEVAARLGELARPGETVDDTIQRVDRERRSIRPT